MRILETNVMQNRQRKENKETEQLQLKNIIQGFYPIFTPLLKALLSYLSIVVNCTVLPNEKHNYLQINLHSKVPQYFAT